MPSVVSAMARLIEYRVEQLEAFKNEGPTPVLEKYLTHWSAKPSV
jgi:ribonucleoside-diphosphate reductase alpha chain